MLKFHLVFCFIFCFKHLIIDIVFFSVLFILLLVEVVSFFLIKAGKVRLNNRLSSYGFVSYL